MNKQALSFLSFLLLSCYFTNAGAVSVQVQFLGPSQVDGTEVITAGLIVHGTTDWYSISVAGGFTITCEYNSIGMPAQHGDKRSDFFRPPGPMTLTVVVPPPQAPGTYPTANFNSVLPGTCRYCYFSWTAKAQGAEVGFSGLGVNVTLPSPEVVQGNTLGVHMCKAPGPGGCERPDDTNEDQ